MQLPDEAPRLPKLPFLIGDAILLATALFIALRSDPPLSATALAVIAGCVGLGAILAVIPFLADYARRQDEDLTERQNSLEALARTTAASAEQISIAASGLHSIAELAQKNLKTAEQLPHKLQERINEFNQQRDEAAVAEIETLTQEVNALRASEAEKLETASDRIHKAVAELAKVEAALGRLPTLGEQAGTKGAQALAAAADAAIARLNSALATAGAGNPVDPPKAEPKRKQSKPAEAPGPKDSPSPDAGSTQAKVIADASPVEPSPEPPKHPIKDIDTHPPFLPSLTNTEASLAHIDEEYSKVLSEEDSAAGEPIGRAASSDGLTRLIATAYIGIGNKLFVRGEGPGLSWDKGVPLQFISIGKWRWETADANAPFTAKLYKNDQVECTAVGTLTLEPGQQTEVTATF